MNKHILIVEDEKEVAHLVSKFLTKAGFTSTHLDKGDLVLPYVLEHNPNLVLLDIMLPESDGIAICHSIRKLSNVPIFMLTARVSEKERLLGLEIGADDYICKPFSAAELVLRIRNFLTRFDAEPKGRGLVLDFISLKVSYASKSIQLTPSEFELIRLLQQQPGIPFSRETIMNRIYKDYRVVSDRAVDSHVKNLRKKLKGIFPEHDFIQAQYGAGYRYVEIG